MPAFGVQHRSRWLLANQENVNLAFNDSSHFIRFYTPINGGSWQFATKRRVIIMDLQMSSDKSSETLLISLAVRMYRKDGILFLEDQACNGLRFWAENFEHLIVLVLISDGEPPAAWVPLDAAVGPAIDRIEIVPLPVAYRPDQFVLALPKTARAIRDAIRRADWNGFAIGGLIGDWASVGALLAHRMGVPFYIWTDRVESSVVRHSTRTGSWRRRLRARLEHRPMALLERFLIRRAPLGLFHGRDTYDTYAPYCRNPQLVHDIHLRKSDHIDALQLERKIAAVSGGPIRICYVGRAHDEKGPGDWLDSLEVLAAEKVEFEATWLGDGPALEMMRKRTSAGPLAGSVKLPGFVRDRQEILDTLRSAHLMLFCHKTPESPRCLIEALASGTPIVGYDSPYPRDLIAQNGGGKMTPKDDPESLARAVADLARDRAKLAKLIRSAYQDGSQFYDEAVFRHRAEVIKAHLPKLKRAS